MNNLKIHRNDQDGVQVEWRGILLTLHLHNEHHGISGSIAEQKDGKTLLLNFHGSNMLKPLPLAFHEETMQKKS